MLKPLRCSSAFFASHKSSYTTNAVPLVFLASPLHYKRSHICTYTASASQPLSFSLHIIHIYIHAELSLGSSSHVHSYLSDGAVFPENLVKLIASDVEG